MNGKITDKPDATIIEHKLKRKYQSRFYYYAFQKRCSTTDSAQAVYTKTDTELFGLSHNWLSEYETHIGS